MSEIVLSTSKSGRLYRGQTSVDFVGRRRIWLLASLVVIVAGLSSLGFRGLNLGIDFKGGSSWQVLAKGITVSQATAAVTSAGLNDPNVFLLGGQTLTVQANLSSLSLADQLTETNKVVTALATLAHRSPNQVSTSSVGPTWGGQVTNRALEALIAFFVAVVAYIAMRFEPKMALAAFIAMLHDLLVTIGVYSLFGFQITPDTVIAILTILGYSLYDTVVVFDRVRDNTRGVMKTGAMTYSEMINLSMNQTLARSINTSLVAILPVLSILVVGAELLGATTLQNYGLALFVGLMSGAYSSIFIASPILAWTKEREPRYRELSLRLETRAARQAVTPAMAARMTDDKNSVGSPSSAAAAATAVVAKPRKRKKR
jgi:preprotein translocase subunit SecF